MSNIFRCPVDHSHYKTSIEDGKDYNWIEKYLTELERETIKQLSLVGKLKYWGSTPGSSNLRFWKRMSPGDEILFYREGDYIGIGIVGAKINNEKLAQATWSVRKDGLTWQLIYFFSEVKEFKIDSNIVNQGLGYSAGPVMGFSAMGEETVKPIIAKFGSINEFIKKYVIDQSKKPLKEFKNVLIQRPEEAEYYLLDLGKLMGQRTYSPDFGRSAFGKKLGEFCDYTTVDELLPPKIVNVAKFIDVIWFEDHSPQQAFEVIHKHGMQDAFVRFQKLRQAYKASKLHIVGPEEQEGEFEKVRKKFDSVEDIVKFNNYDNLIDMHSSFIEAQEKRKAFL